jgi:hypothetical protein
MSSKSINSQKRRKGGELLMKIWCPLMVNQNCNPIKLGRRGRAGAKQLSEWKRGYHVTEIRTGGRGSICEVFLLKSVEN